MRAAVIVSGVVTNIIEASLGFKVAGATMIASETAAIGDTYKAGRFNPPSPAQPDIPALVSMRQARLALLAAGILDQAEAALAAMPGSTGRAAQIEWEYATELRRDHPLIVSLGESLGLDKAAIDALFVQAAAIV